MKGDKPLCDVNKTSENELKSISFEDAVTQLEEVVRDLEAGETSLEEALTRFEVGVQLSRHCIQILDAAQGRIEKLVGELNGDPVLEPMENAFDGL
jgi:exodeoxyribonuclease VII small subunit